jgi:ElaB/YqjD/DUF883 family membrane-anchored ribosome-binding protein
MEQNQHEHLNGQVLHVVETVAEKLDHLREGAAGSLGSAAASLRSTAARGISAIDNLSQGTASRLDSTADFIRDFSAVESIRGMVRRSPGLALGIGVGTGLLVGFCLRRRSPQAVAE